MTIEINKTITRPLKLLADCFERALRANLSPDLYASIEEWENAIKEHSVLRDAREAIRLLEGK